MNTKFLVKNGIFLAVFMGAALLPYQEVIAQGDRPMSTPDRRVSRELWDIWRQGFEYYEKGEMKMISGKYAESLPLYQKSLESFQEVRRQNPQWNRNVIEYRMNLCRRRLMTAKRRADEASDAAKRALNRSNLPVPAPVVSSSVTTSAAGRELDRKLQNAMQENNLRKKQIEELQKELTRLRPDAARADAALRQIRSLMEERTHLEKQLASIKLQFEKIQEEQRKSSPRTAELERLLAAEQNKSAAYAKAFRERSADYAKLEEQLRILNAEQVRRNNEYAELSRKYSAELQSSEKIVRQNAARQNALAQALKKSEAESLRLKNTLDRKNRELEQSAVELRKLRAGRVSADELAGKIEAEAVALRNENRKIKTELESLRTVRAGLENKMTELNAEMIKLRKDLVLNIEQRNDFAKANDSISKQFGELEVSFRKMRDENATLRKQLDTALKERELLASKVNDQLSESLKNRLAAARQEVERLTAERDAAGKEIARLKQFGDPAAMKAETAVAKSKQLEAERNRNEMETRLAEEKRKQAAAVAALAVSQSSVAALESRIKTLQLEAGRSAAEVKVKNDELAGLNAALKSRDARLASLTAEAEQFRTKQQQLVSQLEKSSEGNAALLSRQTQIAAQLKKTEEENSGLRNQQTLLSTQLKKAEEENSGLRNQQTLLSAQLSKQQRTSAAAQQESEIALKRLQAQLKALEESGNEAMIAELRKQIADSTARYAALQQENIALKTESGKLQRQIADSDSKLHRKDLQIQSESDAAKRQLADAAARNTDLQKENEALKKQLAEAELRKKQEKTAVPVPAPVPVPVADPYREKYVALESKYHELQQKYAGLERSSAAAELQLSDTRKQSEMLTRQLSDTRKQNEILTRQLSDTTGKMVAETRQSTAQSQALEQARADLARQEKELADLKSRLLKNRQTAAKREKLRLDLLQEISQLQKTLQATAAERAQLVKELDAAKAKLPTQDELAAAKTAQANTRQEAEQLRNEKSALESNIAGLQARLGRSQAQMEKMQKALTGYEGDVTRLRAALLEFEKTRNQLAEVRKQADDLRQENGNVRKNAEVMEQNLKSEIQKQAGQILAMRDENVRFRDSVRTLTDRRDTLEKEMKQASAEVASLKKQLAKALSEEEKVKLKKRIEELNGTLRKLAEGSEDELVREAASKNVVITDLLKEQEELKSEIRKLTRSAESYRILAVRQRDAAEKAEDNAKIAIYDARKTRGELKMLRADIEDGIIQMPESRRSELLARKRKSKSKIQNQSAAMEVSQSKTKSSTVAVPKSGTKSVSGNTPKAKVKSADVKVASTAPAGKSKAKKTPVPKLSQAYLDAMKKGAEAEKSGDLGMALWHYWQAADMEDKQSAPYMALTRLHLKRKERSSAMKAYKKAVLNGGKRDLKLEQELNK